LERNEIIFKKITMSLLTYAPNATKVGFADILYNNTTFADNLNLTIPQQKDIFYTEANKCRENYQPMWAGEPQFFPSTTLPQGCNSTKITTTTIDPTPIKTVVAPINAQDLTVPPKVKDNTLINLALAGIGVIVLIKILE